ncbi:hypothetical protein BH09PAT2_BH09PAT2_06680 [soil metagenome]
MALKKHQKDWLHKHGGGMGFIAAIIVMLWAVLAVAQTKGF